MTYAEEAQELWFDYRRTGDQQTRDRLILGYEPLVNYFAGRLGSGVAGHVDAGDIVSWGMSGLSGAIERYAGSETSCGRGIGCPVLQMSRRPRAAASVSLVDPLLRGYQDRRRSQYRPTRILSQVSFRSVGPRRWER